MGWSTQVVIANRVIIEGPDDYLFVYNGAPALGTLIESIAAEAGTDQYGNAYLQGSTLYENDGSGNIAALNTNGTNFLNSRVGFTVYSATTPAGPFARLSYLGEGGTVANPGWVSSPVYGMQPQAISGFFGVSDQWNYVGSGGGQPAFATGWGNFGHGGADLAFRLAASPANEVRINGVVTPGAGAAPTLFTLPASYAPASIQFITGSNVTSGGVVYWEINTSGTVVLGGGGLDTGDEYTVNGLYAMDI